MSTLKSRLRAIQKQHFTLPEGVDPLPLFREMLAQIGSPDSELRDELIYTCLCEWIVNQSILPPHELLAALHMLLDTQHMFFRIGEADTDSVFTRSFSSLALALVIFRHRQEAFLSPSDLRAALASLCRYLAEERDLRGYVPGPGWAHAVAHSADTLDELVQCIEFAPADLSHALDAMIGAMSRAELPFVQREDERMATAWVSLLKRELLPLPDMAARMQEQALLLQARSFAPKDFSRWNYRNFLRALYFRLLKEDRQDAADSIRTAESVLMAA